MLVLLTDRSRWCAFRGLLLAVLAGGALLVITASSAVAGVSVEPAFGVGGEAVPGSVPARGPDGGVLAVPGSLASDVHGRLVVPDAGRGLAVLRLTRLGARDVSFAAGGEAVVAAAPGVRATAVAVDAQGRVLVAGADMTAGVVTVARLLDDGSRDRSFGTDGVVRVALPGFMAGEYLWAARVVPVSGGVALALGGDALRYLTVVRLTDAGVLDQRFGGTGVVDLMVAYEVEIADVAVDSADRLDVAVNETPDGKGGIPESRLFRVLPDGTIDGTFDPFGGQHLAPVNEITISPDDHVLLAGGDTFDVGPYASEQGTVGMVQADLPDGLPDTSFGIPLPEDLRGGAGSASLPWRAIGGAQAVVGDDSGRRIALADNSLVAFTATGKPDPSFGRCGVADLAGPTHVSQTFAMIRQPDGPIIIAGTVPTPPRTPYRTPRLKLVAVTSVPPPSRDARPQLEPLETPNFDNADQQQLIAGQVTYPIESAEPTRATLTLTLTGHPGVPRFLASTTRQLEPCQVTTLRLRPAPPVTRALSKLKIAPGYVVAGLRATVTLTNRSGRTRTPVDAPA